MTSCNQLECFISKVVVSLRLKPLVKCTERSEEKDNSPRYEIVMIRHAKKMLGHMIRVKTGFRPLRRLIRA